MGILYHLFVGGRFTVFPEHFVRAQGWEDGLFHNIVAQIKQCEDDEISHIPMMKQGMGFVNYRCFTNSYLLLVVWNKHAIEYDA